MRPHSETPWNFWYSPDYAGSATHAIRRGWGGLYEPTNVDEQFHPEVLHVSPHS